MIGVDDADRLLHDLLEVNGIVVQLGEDHN